MALGIAFQIRFTIGSADQLQRLKSELKLLRQNLKDSAVNGDAAGRGEAGVDASVIIPPK